MNFHVFGTKENENAGNILFTGTREECNEYAAAHLHDNNWYSLSVCDESGRITDRYIEAEPFRQHRKTR